MLFSSPVPVSLLSEFSVKYTNIFVGLGMLVCVFLLCCKSQEVLREMR